IPTWEGPLVYVRKNTKSPGARAPGGTAHPTRHWAEDECGRPRPRIRNTRYTSPEQSNPLFPIQAHWEGRPRKRSAVRTTAMVKATPRDGNSVPTDADRILWGLPDAPRRGSDPGAPREPGATGPGISRRCPGWRREVTERPFVRARKSTVNP